ncbi:Uncharacterised protein [Vibrio cholerae]|nr:Uncharacterised protein [Vibrio cholerae]
MVKTVRSICSILANTEGRRANCAFASSTASSVSFSCGSCLVMAKSNKSFRHSSRRIMLPMGKRVNRSLTRD